MSRLHRRKREENRRAESSKEQLPFLSENSAKCPNGGLRIEGMVDSWDVFFRSESDSLSRRAQGKLSPEDVEDALQETWCSVLKELPQFVGEDAERQLDAWMRTVMRNKIVNAVRRRQFVSLENLAMESMASPEMEIELKRRAWLDARLEEMTADGALNGQLMYGHCRDGRKIADLAAEYEMTAKAVESRICRQIEKLRDAAAEEGLVDPEAS